MENKLEQLLLNKTFNQLTAEEKYYVTEIIGEAEYNRMHVLLKESKTAFKNPPLVKPAIKSNLIAAFQQHHGIIPEKKPAAFMRILRYRLPAWQAAAAIALLFGWHFWMQEKTIIVEKPETFYIHSVDTIYKEIATPTTAEEKPAASQPPRVNVKPKSKPDNWSNEAALFAAVDSASLKYEAAQVPDSFNLMVSQPMGKSATQTADLWNLLEVVY